MLRFVRCLYQSQAHCFSGDDLIASCANTPDCEAHVLYVPSHKSSSPTKNNPIAQVSRLEHTKHPLARCKARQSSRRTHTNYCGSAEGTPHRMQPRRTNLVEGCTQPTRRPAFYCSKQTLSDDLHVFVRTATLYPKLHSFPAGSHFSGVSHRSIVFHSLISLLV